MRIAVDVDGTLFDCMGRAHLIPADPSRSENWIEYNRSRHLDVPRQRVIDLVNGMIVDEVILVTSCGAAARKEMADQLAGAYVLHGGLDMRPMDDHRNSHDYKMSRYRELKPDLIIEDHPWLVKTLRAEGFTVLQIDSKDPSI